jgi:Flp pilus assembly protein TadG
MTRISQSKRRTGAGLLEFTLALLHLKKQPDRRRRRGAELIEFTLVLLPMLGLIFLLLDLGWAVFKRATLQSAVREGCRYAVSNQVQTALKDSSLKSYGVIDSVKWVVQQRAMGFLGSTPTDPGYAAIQVRFYDPNSSLTTALPLPANCASATAAPNSAGNLVEVSVESVQSAALTPVLNRNATPLVFTARSSDRMEGNPMTGVPRTFNGTCP